MRRVACLSPKPLLPKCCNSLRPECSGDFSHFPGIFRMVLNLLRVFIYVIHGNEENRMELYYFFGWGVYKLAYEFSGNNSELDSNIDNMDFIREYWIYKEVLATYIKALLNFVQRLIFCMNIKRTCYKILFNFNSNRFLLLFFFCFKK